MNILRFAEYKTYNEAEIMALYSSVGWSNYTNNPAMLRKAYKNSLYVLAAYADGKLVGILRAVGDGASVVFLQDLIVLPEFQRHGIGSQLMRKVMEKYMPLSINCSSLQKQVKKILLFMNILA